MERKNYKISREVFKFPYNGNCENNDNEMFSEKFCCCTIKVRKKIKKGIEWSIFYLELSLSVANGVIASSSVVLPVFLTSAPKMRVTQSRSEKVKFAPVIQNTANKVIYTEPEIDELKQSVFNQFKKGYDVQQVINMLRAGGMDFDTAFAIALTAAVAYMMYVNRVEGFQPVHHHPPRIGEWGNVNNGGPPHVGGYGKGTGPRSITVTGATNSGFERNLIQNAYSQIPNISVEGTDWEITAWSVAKHVHHGPDFGLDPTKYEMTQSDLDSIAVNGLINHINQGGTPPNADYVKALQKRWKAFAEHKNVRDCGIQPVMGKDCHVRKHHRTRIFLAFDSESGESFTGYQLTKRQSQNHNKYGRIGKNYKN